MKRILTYLSIIVCAFSFAGCFDNELQSASGLTKAEAHVKAGTDGLSNEQRNIKQRIELENEPGSIKHLYVIAPESGQTILYSTVRGKVTSSGKRITPSSYTIAGTTAFQFNVNGQAAYTNEPLGDDGTYGSSDPYIYWWDIRGVYHQHYVSGGQIIHVSNQPIAVKSVIINIEQQ